MSVLPGTLSAHAIWINVLPSQRPQSAKTAARPFLADHLAMAT